MQFYTLHWSKLQTILKNQYERAKSFCCLHISRIVEKLPLTSKQNTFHSIGKLRNSSLSCTQYALQ